MESTIAARPIAPADAAPPEQAHGVGVGAGVDAARQPGVDRVEVAQGAVGDGVPVVPVDGLGDPVVVGGVGEVPFGALQRGPVLAGAQGQVVGAVGGFQLGDVDGEQGPLVVQGVQRRLVLLRADLRGGGAQAAHRRVLLREVLAGPDQLDQDGALAGQLTAL